jgi:hypothetical protein
MVKFFYVTEKQLRDFEWTAEFTNDRLQDDQSFEISQSVDEIRKNQTIKDPTVGKHLFVKGAYLISNAMPYELSEAEFIKAATSGRRGMSDLMEYQEDRFVSLVLDDPSDPFFRGHDHGGTIAMEMEMYKKWQTMEWK